MESRIQHLFLTALLAAASWVPLSLQAQTAADDDELAQIITPDIKRRHIKEDDLDSENFEMGAFYGLYSLEDFGSNPVQGISLAYHITEGFFLEGVFAVSRAEQTSYELLSGGVELLTDEERDIRYYNLSLGYNFLPGQIYFSDKWAFNTNFYVLLGAGNTDFAAKQYFTTNIGAGLRFYATDFLAVDMSMRNHHFSHELFGVTKAVDNLESRIGLSLFF
jgi:outer membrane beta-barrel protein